MEKNNKLHSMQVFNYVKRSCSGKSKVLIIMLVKNNQILYFSSILMKVKISKRRPNKSKENKFMMQQDHSAYDASLLCSQFP